MKLPAMPAVCLFVLSCFFCGQAAAINDDAVRFTFVAKQNPAYPERWLFDFTMTNVSAVPLDFLSFNKYDNVGGNAPFSPAHWRQDAGGGGNGDFFSSQYWYQSDCYECASSTNPLLPGQSLSGFVYEYYYGYPARVYWLARGFDNNNNSRTLYEGSFSTAVPEPASALLLLAGMCLLALHRQSRTPVGVDAASSSAAPMRVHPSEG